MKRTGGMAGVGSAADPNPPLHASPPARGLKTCWRRKSLAGSRVEGNARKCPRGNSENRARVSSPLPRPPPPAPSRGPAGRSAAAAAAVESRAPDSVDARSRGCTGAAGGGG